MEDTPVPSPPHRDDPFTPLITSSSRPAGMLQPLEALEARLRAMKAPNYIATAAGSGMGLKNTEGVASARSMLAELRAAASMGPPIRPLESHGSSGSDFVARSSGIDPDLASSFAAAPSYYFLSCSSSSEEEEEEEEEGEGEQDASGSDSFFSSDSAQSASSSEAPSSSNSDSEAHSGEVEEGRGGAATRAQTHLPAGVLSGSGTSRLRIPLLPSPTLDTDTEVL